MLFNDKMNTHCKGGDVGRFGNRRDVNRILGQVISNRWACVLNWWTNAQYI